MHISNTQDQRSGALVEQKFFELRGPQAESLLQAAIEHAAGMEMEELAPGMWLGQREVSRWSVLEVTARVMPTERGTSVELRVEHKTNPAGMAIFIFGIIFASILLIPLIWLVARAHKAQQKAARDRLVLMHKLWREAAEAIGAPKRSSYRDAPKRVYAPQAEQDEAATEPEATVDREAAAEAEAAALAEAEAEAEAEARMGRDS